MNDVAGDPVFGSMQRLLDAIPAIIPRKQRYGCGKFSVTVGNARLVSGEVGSAFFPQQYGEHAVDISLAERPKDIACPVSIRSGDCEGNVCSDAWVVRPYNGMIRSECPFIQSYKPPLLIMFFVNLINGNANRQRTIGIQNLVAFKQVVDPVGKPAVRGDDD